MGLLRSVIMDERKRDEIIADIEDIKTNIEHVRYLHPREGDAILDDAVKSLGEVADTIETDEDE